MIYEVDPSIWATYFDFTNISNVVNILIVTLMVFYNIRTRVEVIVNKARAKDLLTDVQTRDEFIEMTSLELKFLADTLMMIVQSSKISDADKLSITSNWAKLEQALEVQRVKTTINKTVETGQEIIQQASEASVAITGLVTSTKDILGNVVKPK